MSMNIGDKVAITITQENAHVQAAKSAATAVFAFICAMAVLSAVTVQTVLGLQNQNMQVPLWSTASLVISFLALGYAAISNARLTVRYSLIAVTGRH
ncbi:hypothetical protein I8H83_00785 [Candidatus Saccharibacteria bacterium]|nr:hypothetical protein [Candidatus Saccharibacteria bacterium]